MQSANQPDGKPAEGDACHAADKRAMSQARACEVGSRGADDTSSKNQPGYFARLGKPDGLGGTPAPELLLSASVRLENGLDHRVHSRPIHANHHSCP